MLYGEKSREELNKYAEKLFQKDENVLVRQKRMRLYDNLMNWFNMPTSVAEEMILFKKDIREFTAFDIFCVVYFIDRKALSKFFTENEIAAFSNDKYAVEKVDFPITFNNMVQVADDQWIGRITCKELMRLKRSRLINYDANEQRALKRIKSGQEEIFKPFVNKRNVKEIREAMERGVYVPDPITLNMPEGAEFLYNDKKYSLKVFSLPNGMFNLDDGYHRYLAMSQISDLNKDFDYMMELRVINFPNAKANSFIFQQDQKTRMQKIVSKTYDTSAVPNRIIKMVNEDSSCYISGKIGRNNSNINSASMAYLLSNFMIPRRIKPENQMQAVIKIKNDLIRKFNTLVEQDAKFAGKYSDQMLYVTLYVFASDIPEHKYAEVINDVVGSLTPEESKVLNITSANGVRRKAIDLVENKLSKWR